KELGSLRKNGAPRSSSSEGSVFLVARTATVSPENKEGLVQHHNPSSKKLFLFLFSFLFGLFLSCHRHLLLGFGGWALSEDANLLLRRRGVCLKNLPHFLGEGSIMTK